MNVYGQISSNRLKTYLIIGLFIAFISLFFYLLGLWFGDSEFFFLMGLLIAGGSGFVSYFFSDKIVLSLSGAKPAVKEEYFDYYTVTENLAIAAGLPMPKLYVIEDETPNAFATGRDPKHAVVAATTGLLKRLDRSDIEGVVAHELSHIKNYDILVMSVVTVLVGTVAYTADFVMRSMWWGGRSSRDRGGGALSVVLLIVMLLVMPLVATIIKLAVSRKREYLADASGVLLTRNPAGLADALEKMSAAGPMRKASSATAHLYITNPFGSGRTKNFLTGLFSTHPPIDRRIKILRGMEKSG